MKTHVLCVLLLTGCLAAQTSTPAVASAPAKASLTLTIPAGTRVPLSLKQAISTKTAKEGDSVYAETAFPFAVNDRIVIPAGTYIQGRITHVQRAGRVKGRAEILMHFTSMIYPSGYTVMLGGSVENVPGAEKATVKGSEGTIRQDGEKGKDVGTVASTASTGAVIGALSGGGKGAGIGAGVGGVTGLAIAMLSRGSDVRMEPGMSIEMEIQRDITVDASRVTSRRAVMIE
jgi:type IV secretion system protein VirB10